MRAVMGQLRTGVFWCQRMSFWWRGGAGFHLPDKGFQDRMSIEAGPGVASTGGTDVGSVFGKVAGSGWKV